MQAPTPAAATDPFGNDPFAIGDSGGFGDNLLTPDKIETAQEEAAPEPQGRKDAFGDLVEIGGKNKQNKSPKQMFVDLATPPKKSLNELKVETVPSPKPASPLGFQASEAVEGVNKGTSPSPADFSTCGQLGDPFGAEDPFTNLAPNVNQNAPATTGFSAPPQKTNLGASIFDDDFNLPAPKGAPPPLPVNLGDVSTSALNIPPPPPRTNVTAYQNTQNTPPLPPRPISDKFSHKSSKDNTSEGSKVVGVPETPPLPPRLYLQNNVNGDSSVPNNSLSKVITKDNDSNTVVIDKPLSEIPADSIRCSNLLAKMNKQDNTQHRLDISDDQSQAIVNKNELSEASHTEKGIENENSGIFDISGVKSNELGQGVSNKSDHTQVKQDQTEFTQTSPKGSNSTLDDLDKNTKNLIDSKTAVNHFKEKKIISDHGDLLNCDTYRISVASANIIDEGTKNNNSQTSATVDSNVDHNFNKTSFSSVSDPFVSIDPFASEDPFAQQTDPFSADPFASDPFSDSISTTSVSSSGSNDPFTTTFASQKSSHTSVEVSDDPFSVFDNTFEPFHFDKTKKSKIKLKQQAGKLIKGF